MTEPAAPIVHEIKFVVTFHPDSNTFEVNIPPSNMPNVEMWHVLKMAVQQMVKSAPFFADPVERAQVTAAAEGMRLIFLGAEQVIDQQQKSRLMIMKEMGATGGSGAQGG